MNNNEQRLIDYVNHMVQAIERIEIYTEDLDENAFFDNLLVQDAIV